MSKYIYPKKKFNKKDVDFMYLFFDNGDYFSLHGSEVVDMKLNLYDRLIWGERGVCPVVESGYIKLDVKKRNKAIYDGYFLYNAKKYRGDRKTYIVNRLVSEGGISHVRLFDENNWHDTLCGNITAEMEGEFLILKFLPQEKFGSSDGENHVILLNEIGKTIVNSIDLDFENCESFYVYKDEIQDMQLQFEEELVWGAGDLFRNVKCGFIKIKFDKDIDYRQVYFLSDDNVTIKKLEKRLLWKKMQSDHDICHLYINFEYAGFGSNRTECVEIEDIRPNEELERLAKLEEEGCFGFADYIGGYCKKQKNGAIVITFGKNAEDLLNKL